MATLPAVPPILDQDRYIFLSAVSTVTTVNVTFPVFGDGSDLIIEVNNVPLTSSQYTFTSPSGPLNLLPLPITDGIVTFTPPIAIGSIAIIGAWHARQVIQPSAPGISRREFNQTISTLIAGAREVERALRTALDFVQTDNLGNGFYNAEGELVSNVADPQSAKDAVNLETLTTALGELVATGGTTLPVQWTLAGDGVTTAFHITGANIPTPLAYYVSVNGLLLNPSTDYAINPATNFITFTIAPVNGGLICVRMLGYARGVGNISTTAQAVAGTDDTTYMSPLKVAQASVATIANFLASNPALTGVPTAPTAAPGTNTAQIATCAFVAAAAASAAPPGMTGLFPFSTPPTGWLASSGQLLSRTTYAALWAAAQSSGNIVSDATWTGGAGLYDGAFSTGDGSTTFRIPYANGNFFRAWDNGRGVDTGRAIGSMQLDAMQTHEFSYSGPTTTGVGGSGGASGFDFGISTQTTTGNTGRTATETRPRNISQLACIKT